MSAAISSIGAARRRSALQRALGAAITEALEADDVVEALVNEDGVVWLDRVGGGLERTKHSLSAPDREAAIRLLAHEAGETVGEDRPTLATILPDSAARVQAVLPPLASAPILAIRKRPRLIYRLADYVETGVATAAQAERLAASVAAKRNIVVAGGTGSGKTTLRHRAPRRQRCDRGASAALEVLKAWNTGHPGGLLSLHANSAQDALTRLEDLCMEARATPPSRLIEASIDMVVFIARRKGGRVITDIIDLWEERGGAR